MVRKTNLVSVDILLRCDKEIHTDCVDLQSALVEKFNDITESHTIETIPKESFCVSAAAKIDPNNQENFEEKLYQLKFGENDKLGIDKVKLYVKTD